MNIGENIFNLRKFKGMSQEELAHKLLVSRQTISLWETNQTLPTIDNFLRLKEIFGVSVDRILSAEESKNTHTNSNSLETIYAALAYAMGINPPGCAAEKIANLQIILT